MEAEEVAARLLAAGRPCGAFLVARHQALSSSLDDSENVISRIGAVKRGTVAEIGKRVKGEQDENSEGRGEPTSYGIAVPVLPADLFTFGLSYGAMRIAGEESSYLF